MNNKMKKGIIVVAIAVLIVSVYFIAGILLYTNNQYNKINIANLVETAGTLKNFTPAIVFANKDEAADWVSGIENYGSYRITLINRNGQIMYDTDADSSVMGNHLDRLEFQTAIKEGTGTALRRSETIGQYYLYAAAAVDDSSGEFAGVLRLSRLIPGFYTHLLSSTLPFLIIGFCIILGTCAYLYRFSRGLSLSAEKQLDTALQNKTAELKIKTDEAKEESRHREAILNSLFEGVITLDSKLHIILANSSFCSLFGIDKEKNIRGMSLIEFSHSAELEEAAELVLTTGQSQELTLKRYESGIQQYYQVFAASWEANEAERGVVMVIGDISRLVKLEQVRKDFAANVSHELRTPIQVIQGFAENILASSNQKEIYHFAEIILKNAQSMDNITNDLLTLVSLENKDAVRPPLEDTVLSVLIAEAVDLVSLTAQKKKSIITVSCPASLHAWLYNSLFVHALVNLLDNSVKYSNESSPIAINAFQKEHRIIIEVSDKGIGIPAEHLDRIFERFYRIDRSRSRESGGTGLGLSIVRHIAMLHGGSVEAESHVNEGSVFRMILPIEH